jgi:uncharacterized protein (TIGR03067 family)
MKILAIAAAFLPLTIVGAPGPKTEVKPETELQRMAGTWEYQSQAIGGRELPADRRANIWVVIDGDVMTRETGLAPGAKDKIKLDTTTSPKSIDLISIDHPSGKTFTEVGIYEWDGETLRLCMDNTGKERPKEFKSPAGKEQIYLSVLKKRKEK